MSFNLPKDFTDRMKEMLADEYDEFLHSYETTNYQALRVNRLKGDVNTFQTVCGFASEAEPVEWTCDGFYYPPALRPGKHPYHEAGVYYVQEPSAMMPATLLNAQPGEKVLDLCAAPGGKSSQIASAMQQQGILISNEIHPARARVLSENMERMGTRNAIVTNESPQTLALRFPSYFDRIMVDAPCSGEGMFRKNEEAISQWSLENVRACANRQDEILDCADRMLRPGGTMVYSTCTFAPDENEGSIARFTERHPQYEILRQTRLWPHKIKGEGHFVALLQKQGGKDSGAAACSVALGKSNLILEQNSVLSSTASTRKKGKNSNSNEPDFTALQQFLDETLRLPLSGPVERFGDQIYLLPENAPSLSGLRVLRPGLHLGTMLKHRFEPSHALALTLRPEDVNFFVSFRSGQLEEYRTACNYIGGETFRWDGTKGWHLICLDNYSLGWGKLAGGIMKNHYPKGLRKTY